MASSVDVTKWDLYDIIGVPETATEKEIVKAYRKQALKCHPDKNPDNADAAEKFHKLSKALEVLTDAAAKAAYDKILKAKKAAQIRHRQLDAKRKKFKDDLEARESAAQNQKEDDKAAALRLQAEIERLRKEGSRLVEHEQELLREELKKKASEAVKTEEEPGSDGEGEGATATAKLRVKWSKGKGDNPHPGYTTESLQKIFSKYGEVLNLLVSVKKSGTAIVELSSQYSADLAVQNEVGDIDNPLKVSWLQGQPPTRVSPPKPTDNTAQNASSSPRPTLPQVPPVAMATSGSHDFESVVLMRMRQAEERKRLIQQMQEDDGDT